MRSSVTVLAPAKLNLALDVVGVLPGGYHALDMTMQAISLYERVVIRRSPYLDLTLPGSKVKAGPGNTAIKAALFTSANSPAYVRSGVNGDAFSAVSSCAGAGASGAVSPLFARALTLKTSMSAAVSSAKRNFNGIGDPFLTF